MAGPDQGVGVRRRGRPLRLPADDTAFTDRFPDAWPRLAWLLVSSRLLGRRRELASREVFVAELRKLGLASDPTRVSRWESGAHPVSARVLSAYETCLGRRSGTFLAISRSMLRSAGTPAPPSGKGAVAPEGAPSQEGVEKLIGIVVRASDELSPALNGAEWLRLSLDLARFEGVFLQRSTWSAICGRLLHELARTGGFDRLQRYEACVALLGIQAAKGPLLRALGEWLTDPDMQLIQPMLALLAEADDEGVGDLIIRLMEGPNRRLAEQAVGVAAAKVLRGHYDAAALEQLESFVLARTSNPRVPVGLTTFDLAAQLPEAAQSRLIETACHAQMRQRLEMHAQTGCLVGPRVTGPVVRSLAAGVQTKVFASQDDEPDPMLQRLIKEMLFHVNAFRRYDAAHILTVSPYVDALAVGCADLTSSRDPLVANAAWVSLHVLSHGQSSPEVIRLALAEHRPEVRAMALAHLGQAAGELDDELCLELVRTANQTDDQSVRLAVVAALGRAGSECLSKVAELSEETHRAAVWWRRLGPALRDADDR